MVKIRKIPKVEIYYREKGKKRWFRSGLVYPLRNILEAQKKMEQLYVKNKGNTQYILFEFKNK